MLFALCHNFVLASLSFFVVNNGASVVIAKLLFILRCSGNVFNENYYTSFRILVGFMLPTSFLSMWISNAATTAMMIPVAESVIEQMLPQNGQRQKQIVEEEAINGLTPDKIEQSGIGKIKSCVV